MAHKHKGLTLDEKLFFTNCVSNKISKTLKVVDLLCKLSSLLQRQILLTIYEFFIYKSYKTPLGLWWRYVKSASKWIYFQQNNVCPIWGCISNHWSHAKIILGKMLPRNWFRAFPSKVVNKTIVFILKLLSEQSLYIYP